jgi:hypothetical protein
MSIKDKSAGIDRRTYLMGGASMLAAPLLTACGGGSGESGEASASGSGEPASVTIQSVSNYTRAISFNTAVREVYFIEVAHRGTLQSNVMVYTGIPGNVTTTVLSDRPANTGTAYAVQFATLDTGPIGAANTAAERTLLQDNLRFLVTVTGSQGAKQGRFGGTSANLTLDVTRTTYNDSTPHTEWLVAYSGIASATNWDVVIRIFRAATADRGAARTSWLSEVVKNEPAHDHNGNVTITYQNPDPGLAGIDISAAYSAGYIADTATGADTIVLASHRHTGHYELVKPLYHTHTAIHSHEHTLRYILRHIIRFGSTISSAYAGDATVVGSWDRRLQAEALKLVYPGSTVPSSRFPGIPIKSST